MKNEGMKNPVLDKSYAFAKEIVLIYKKMLINREFVLSRQIVRCGTSIGANVEEAQGAQSPRDFVAKMQISLKEAKETHFWLRLLRDTETIEQQEANTLIKDCEELIYLLTAILKKAKENLGKK